MEDNRLDLLMTYTTFHLGVYISLITALIGVAVLGKAQSTFLRFSVACFLVAGACGTVLGSNIPEFTDFTLFSQTNIGPWGLALFTYWVWSTVEHLAFWVGITPLAASYIFCGPCIFKKA
jgi:hypothetical protein